MTAMTQLQISLPALLYTEGAGSEYGWVSQWNLFYSQNGAANHHLSTPSTALETHMGEERRISAYIFTRYFILHNLCEFIVKPLI